MRTSRPLLRAAATTAAAVLALAVLTGPAHAAPAAATHTATTSPTPGLPLGSIIGGLSPSVAAAVQQALATLFGTGI